MKSHKTPFMYINGCTLNVLCWAKFYSNWSLATVKLIWYKKWIKIKIKIKETHSQNLHIIILIMAEHQSKGWSHTNINAGLQFT